MIISYVFFNERDAKFCVIFVERRPRFQIFSKYKRVNKTSVYYITVAAKKLDW